MIWAPKKIHISLSMTILWKVMHTIGISIKAILKQKVVLVQPIIAIHTHQIPKITFIVKDSHIHKELMKFITKNSTSMKTNKIKITLIWFRTGTQILEKR